MTPTYSQADLQAMINGMTHQKAAQCVDIQATMNRAVRFVLGDIDLRSTKRSAQLSPNLFDDEYDYAAPSDLKETALIDIRKQVQRSSFEKFYLVDESEFDRKKGILPYRVALKDANFSRILKIDGVEGTKRAVINACNSLTANGAWSAAADASNLTLDSDNYITAGGALNFDMAKGAATGYIENSTMTAVNLTVYQDIGSIFVWVFIPDYSDAQGDTVTNFILRIGSSSSAYSSITVTTNNEGLTFYDGWNLLRFDLNGSTSTGTPAYSAINYLRLTVTKSTSLEADTDWRVDDFVARIGSIYDTIYYSKYGWQTSAGVYAEESSGATDLVIADTEEIEIIATKGAEYAAQELKEKDDLLMFKSDYERFKRKYKGTYPSERMKRKMWYSRSRNPNSINKIRHFT